MLFNYIKLAFRTLLKNKLFTTITIFGLAIGISSAILISQYVVYELNYDRFYPGYENMYRVTYQKKLDGKVVEDLAMSPNPLATALREELPEVKLVTQFYSWQNVTVSTAQSLRFNEEDIFVTDSLFTKVFPLLITRGSIESQGCFISESVANKYFGDRDPIDEILTFRFGEDILNYKIAGVFENISNQTHFKYQIFIVANRLIDSDRWQGTGSYTYVNLTQGSDPKLFQIKLQQLAERKTRGLSDFNVSVFLKLQPLKDIHLYSDLQNEIQVNGNYRSVLFLMIMGILILVISWINYANLCTARSVERAREIGIRKVIGSARSNLVHQFLVEAVVYNLISVGLAACFVLILAPLFDELTGKALSFSELLDLRFLLGACGLFLLGLCATGLYPAFAYASFQPINALKGDSKGTASGLLFRQGLVIFQFSASTFLIIGTVTVYNQLEFMYQQDLGMNIEQMVIVKAPNLLKETWSNELVSYKIDSSYFYKTKNFSSNLSRNASFKVAALSHIPGKELIWGTEGYRREGEQQVHSLFMAGIDYDFMETFGVRLLAGRNFSENRKTDQLTNVIINDEARQLLGFNSPQQAVGQNLVFYDGVKKEIIGVIANYHQESLRKSIKPVYFQLLPRAMDYFAIKIHAIYLEEAVSQIKNEWNTTFPDSPFNYFFLDDFFNQQYRDDRMFGKVFAIFTGLTLFVACLGLFGLASFIILRRTKEIGIRKILGATIQDIVVLLSSNFVKLVLLANIVAFPLAYLAINTWLAEFAYRAPISWSVFAFAGSITLFFSCFAISYQAVRTSYSNPINSLRTE